MGLGAIADKILDLVPFLKRFPVTAIIYEQRSDGLHVRLDKARRVIEKDKNKQYYQFKGSQEKTLPIDLNYVTSGNFVTLFSPKPKYYYPMVLNAEDIKKAQPDLKVIPDNMANFHMLAGQELVDRTTVKEKWKELIPIASLGFVVIAIGLGVFITFQGVEGWMDAFTSGTAQMTQASNTLAAACNAVRGVTTTTVPPF